jgi:hypothetical protein
LPESRVGARLVSAFTLGVDHIKRGWTEVVRLRGDIGTPTFHSYVVSIRIETRSAPRSAAAESGGVFQRAVVQGIASPEHLSAEKAVARRWRGAGDNWDFEGVAESQTRAEPQESGGVTTESCFAQPPHLQVFLTDAAAPSTP